jgi:hypothetical protein
MTEQTPSANPTVIAAETEASRALAAEAAVDNPNPPADAAQPQERAPAPAPEPADGAKPLQRGTAFDRGRADIASRFKEKRAASGGQVEFHGDMRDPSQTYGGHATPADAAPDAPPPGAAVAPGEADAAQPRLMPLKVHGRDLYLPEQDVIAEAQKSLAAGNILETAKEFLQGAKRAAPDRPNPGDAPAPRSDAPPADDPYKQLADNLTFGTDPDAAAQQLRQTIEGERQTAAREAVRQVRLENELTASQRAMATFEQAHPELASDEFARDAVTTQVQREVNADLQRAVNQGVLADIPRTQDERNGLHTQLRAFGAPVRPMAEIFTAASQKYQTWRGEKPAPQPASTSAPNQPAASAAPRVELSPDRAQRRAAIPTQPASGSVPPRAAAPPAEQNLAQKRSAAVMAMRRARGQIVA